MQSIEAALDSVGQAALDKAAADFR
jgi:hypothetical protein